MNTGNRDQGAGNRDLGGFEATLRLIAQLPAPEGLAERVQSSLRAAPDSISAPASGAARLLHWPVALRPSAYWTQCALARTAAAAAIVVVVIGGGWGVAAHVHPPQPNRASSLPPRLNAPGGFASAGAMRTPKTLNRPLAAYPATTAQTQSGKNAAMAPSARKAHRRGQAGATNKATAEPAAAQTK